MKRISLILAAVLLMLTVCGCKAFGGGPSGASADSASTRDQATRDQATGDEATRDEASFVEVPSPQDAAILHPFNYQISPVVFKNALKHKKAVLNSDELLQNPELPTGCESVALTSALKTLGYKLEKTEIAEKYLTYGEDVMWDYVGDPAAFDGAGIFAPGLTNSANLYLQAKKSQHAAYNTMGVKFEDLFKLIDQGYPVVIWTTMDYEPPVLDDVAYEYKDQYYFWYQLEHCVMMFGFDLDSKTVSINDPLQGVVEIPIDKMEKVYNETGKMSMTVMDKIS